ncbi:acyl-CoA dehydrogenase family protein [Peribacillus castrilensis]|jgi:acyl-CoA dehydrogenase|uniref:Acyl-CoA dehydrogenase domain-containing protein n=1 Tax=Peribacillus simplex TaxID=1478 RepID=A0AAN2PH89_9BACI|nr:MULTISPECIES: acyl-CoA dehydrogenase family protein [Bacillaceae]MBL3644722.1 acyl-CoA dehydrogenase family protein [Bacillus sp. RHFB]MCP1093457.1 acyl-CoA dehydrogenase family protein [Bacillaceae bacterium OS4b]QYF81160.1 acyl-CoA dehydrogenase family protein [Brevibacterium sp. PAMC21349]MBD8588588.1 acyl-CoA dehydrogenase family protein [Peribacillus simplex]MBT2615769.1 acyl-CoA dehydrogenase family protein [Bacillus sp. ISL-78]
MTITLTKEMQQMKEMIRNFVEREVEPFAIQIEEEDAIPGHLVEKAKDLGLFGISIPEQYGGIGLNAVGKATVLEQLGRTHNGFVSLISAHTGIGSTGLVKLASEHLKNKYLPEMAAGTKIGAFALSEPGAGSDATNLATSAEKKGDYWVMNGTKHFITNGPIADVYTVFALTDKDKGAKGGITAFLVERDFPGLTVGKKDKKMGLRGSYTSQVIFEDCIIPEENVIGEVGMGYISALKILGEGRVGLAARAVGSSGKLIELSAKYAKERIQFGKPIADNQAIQWMLADMATETEAARALTMMAAQKIDEGKKVIKEASMAKLFASDVFNRVADKAVQIHGGMGYMAEYPVERFYRDARITKIYEGTNEIQRLIIARNVLEEC